MKIQGIKFTELLTVDECQLLSHVTEWQEANSNHQVIIGGSLALKLQGIYLKRECHDLDLQIPGVQPKEIGEPNGFRLKNPDEDLPSWNDSVLFYKNDAISVDVLYNQIPDEFINSVNGLLVVSPAWIVASKKYYIMNFINYNEFLMYQLIGADNIDLRLEILAKAEINLTERAKKALLKHVFDLHVMNSIVSNTNGKIFQSLQSAGWSREEPTGFLCMPWQQFAALKETQVNNVSKRVEDKDDEFLPF